MKGNDGAVPASRYKWPPEKCKSVLLNMGEILAESNKPNRDFKSDTLIANMLGNPIPKM